MFHLKVIDNHRFDRPKHEILIRFNVRIIQNTIQKRPMSTGTLLLLGIE